MRSIRISLLVYFLALLALALAAFSFLIYENSKARLAVVYESTHELMEKEREKARQVREEQYQKTSQTLYTNFDAALLLKAQTMASQLAETMIRPERVFAARPIAPVVPIVLAPHGPAVPLYFASYFDTELRHGWSSPRWTGRRQLDLAQAEEILHSSRAERVPAVYQVYNEQGEIMARSRLLNEENLPLDPKAAQMKLLEPDFDNVVLPSGRKFRCVTLRVPITRLSVTRLWPTGGGDRRRGGPPGPPPAPAPGRGSGEEGTPPVPGGGSGGESGGVAQGGARPGNANVPPGQFGPLAPPGFPPMVPPMRAQTSLIPVDPEAIQRGDVPKVILVYAKPTTEVEETLADLRAELDAGQRLLEEAQAQTLQELEEHSRAALLTLRNRLLLISVGVFAATVIGGFWIVRWALSPLKRLTCAVSKVSEKDFQLRIAPEQVPEELKPIVERLRQSLASLEKAFAREKQAAADISHDLRTPIASLLATTQVCLRRPRSSEEYRTALENCRQIGMQLNRLVERLLALARLDAGADRLQTELVDVTELAEECVSVVKPLAEQKGLRVSFDKNGPILLETDAGKLREVLTNLLDNAIEYNRPHGLIEVGVRRDNGEVEIEVRDTGIGIAPEAQEHLFERFYRADPSRQSDTSHCGLGLAIVKGYVDLLGGRISVHSQPGAGSSFKVRFSADKSLDSEPEANESPQTARSPA
ncbi:MAG: ATP-binding protein [Gemmatales bacterium]|nr:ATP-binding protein [Gemmatales bacterium]MDW8385936.1 ATP-binding protein [Gemmatales bacterium]